MKRKMIPWMSGLLCLLLLLPVQKAVCHPSHLVDWNQKGSIRITLREQNDALPLEGAELTAFFVAAPDRETPDLTLRYTPDFSACLADLSDLQDRSLPELLADYAADKAISGQPVRTDADGRALWQQLPLGLYLIVQTEKKPGFSACAPFLVLIPKEENGAWTYDLEGAPKTEPVRLCSIQVRKIWKPHPDYHKKLPTEVQIQLLKGSQVVDTVTLNEENDFQYVWPELEQRADWSVREIHIPRDFQVTYEKNGATFLVINTTKLPGTGQKDYLVPILAAAGLLLVSAGLLLLTKKERRA